MRQINVGGKTHSFPDDATDEEIQAALAPDFVGKAKAHLTAEPDQPRPDYLGVGGPDLGKYVRAAGRFMLPGTKGELARDVAMSAVPLSKFLAPGSKVLAPAIERTAYAGAQPILESGDFQQGGKQAASTAALEALMGILGFAHNLPGRAKQALQQVGTPPAAVHQAANFEKALGPAGGTPPIVFQRVNSGSTPSVTGGTMGAITPNTVTVKPPLSGSPIYGGPAPAAILQESMPRPPLPPLKPWPAPPIKSAIDIAGAQNPEEFGLPVGLGALTKIKELSHLFGQAAPLLQ